MSHEELNTAIFASSLALGLIFWCVTVRLLIVWYLGFTPYMFDPTQVMPADDSWFGLAMAYFVMCVAFFPIWMLSKVKET